jgi:thiosulfate/3-mercaptopyruvate sulfurtransferase
MKDSALVSCEWLYQNINSPTLIILDATFFLPRQQRNATSEFLSGHIPGALFFDIDVVADLTAPLPHTLPDESLFAKWAGKMGINNNSQIVIYDNNHFFAAARAWWMFRVFGHQQVRIVDGGLRRWLHLNYPLETSTKQPDKQLFTPHYQVHLVCNLVQMQQIVSTHNHQIVDSRSPDSFAGQRPLSDPTLKPGHIPNSINIPYSTLLTADHKLLTVTQLMLLLEKAGVDFKAPIVTSCGSGVSAAVLALALYECGVQNVPLYDGSWAEWGRQTDTQKNTLCH